MHQNVAAAAFHTKGQVGAVVIEVPGSVMRARQARKKTKVTHLVVYQYETQEHVQAWTNHSIRTELVSQLQSLLNDTRVAVRIHDSLADVASGHTTSFDITPTLLARPNLGGIDAGQVEDREAMRGRGRSRTNLRLRHDPPAYKIWTVVLFSLLVVILALDPTVVLPWVESWWCVEGSGGGGGGGNGTEVKELEHLFVTSSVQNCIHVLLLVYLMLPLLMGSRCHTWVFASWSESPYVCVAVMQRGFGCWDTVGKT